MYRNRVSYLRCFGRTDFFVAIAAFILIFLASGTSFAKLAGDNDISEDIFASVLAPVVDYGISSGRSAAGRSKEEPRSMSPMQTPPPGVEEMESTDPKPHKPLDRPGIPVDPSFLDLPLACTAPVVDASTRSGNED